MIWLLLCDTENEENKDSWMSFSIEDYYSVENKTRFLLNGGLEQGAIIHSKLKVKK